MVISVVNKSSLGWLLAWLKRGSLEVAISVVDKSSLGWLLALLKRGSLEVVISVVKKGQFRMVKRGSL